MPQSASRSEISLLYITGVVQGLALVTFPAASAIFTSPSGFALSGTQYGTMFIPQVTLAILTAALGGPLAEKLGLRAVLQLGLCANLLSMLLLAAAAMLMGAQVAYTVLCIATAALGLGFGATTMTLNTLVQGVAAGRRDAAVLTLNALIGLGTALAPLLVTFFGRLGAWWVLPVLMSLSFSALLMAIRAAPMPLPHAVGGARGVLPPRFWLFAAAVLFYGIAETLTGNWAALYLTTQRQVSPDNAAFALSAFWVMLTLGRILFAVLARLLPVTPVYIGLPILLAIAFQFVARADGAVSGIVAFSFVGLACSAILPLSLSFAGRDFPGRSAAMLGGLIAFYQLGYGIAAFGGGPLVDSVGLAYSTVFSIGSVVALALAAVSLFIVRPRLSPQSVG